MQNKDTLDAAAAGEAEGKGLKFDEGKLPMSLIDPIFLEGLARVLAFGAKKYSAHNWRKGIAYSRVLDALIRHTQEMVKGNDIDPETGELHAFHAGCCLMFIGNFQMTGQTELDDRCKEGKPSAPLPVGGINIADKPTYHIEKWFVGFGDRLNGCIKNHPTIPPDQLATTSRIMLHDQTNGIVETRNSFYILGTPF